MIRGQDAVLRLDHAPVVEAEVHSLARFDAQCGLIERKLCGRDTQIGWSLRVRRPWGRTCVSQTQPQNTHEADGGDT